MCLRVSILFANFATSIFENVCAVLCRAEVFDVIVCDFMLLLEVFDVVGWSDAGGLAW